MLPFTDEEFEIMIYELTGKEKQSYDMLCEFADRLLKPVVRTWCNSNKTIKSGCSADDMMQDIYVRLMLTCVTNFLRHKKAVGGINRDKVWFCKWMFTVAKNIRNDKLEKFKTRNQKQCPLDEKLAAELEIENLEDERRAQILEMFELVLSLKMKAYKKLTWIVLSLYIIRYDISKIHATNIMVDTLSEKTLFAIWDEAKKSFNEIEWMDVPPLSIEGFEISLAERFDENRLVGEMIYKEVFMKKGGKAAISDWCNRINSTIKSRMSYETFDN